MPTVHAASDSSPGLPLVVQLGFAGARFLLDRDAHPGVDPAAFAGEVERQLTELLEALPSRLELSDRHFVCGVSALAVGADTAFTRACQTLNWPQRILLPQQREDFLQALGSGGKPDFTEPERAAARELFASPHVIQERVVSESLNRHARFQDVNLELVRECDVLVCLTQVAGTEKEGGTHEVVENAKQRGRAVLEIVVSVTPEGQPRLEPSWHNKFLRPALPEELSGLATDLTGIPSVADYYQPLKKFASRQSKLKQTTFLIGALIVIGTHVLATACAVLALKLHAAAALPWVLGGELLLLSLGFIMHQYLHRSHATRVWAMARLVTEVARSGLALRQAIGAPSHFFTLPMPTSLLPLLRTLNVVHLRETRDLPPTDWMARREDYVVNRLTDPKKGQIGYYGGKLRVATRWYRIAYYTFLTGSVCAFVATLGKLLLICDCLPVPHEQHDGWAALLGSLAILLPVVAVAALSLAASSDLEARCHIYAEMLDFLETQNKYLAHASSERAFSTLAHETETKLLGETAAWYSRRAFTGVT